MFGKGKGDGGELSEETEARLGRSLQAIVRTLALREMRVLRREMT
jgi:hypothetical protein